MLRNMTVFAILAMAVAFTWLAMADGAFSNQVEFWMLLLPIPVVLVVGAVVGFVGDSMLRWGLSACIPMIVVSSLMAYTVVTQPLTEGSGSSFLLAFYWTLTTLFLGVVIEWLRTIFRNQKRN